jgi:hypothetical protein
LVILLGDVGMNNQAEWNPLAIDSVWNRYLITHTNNINYISFIEFVKQDSITAQFKQEVANMRLFEKQHNQLEKASWNLFYLLSLAGGVYALCDGFDGMVSILNAVLPQLSQGLVVAIGALSALSALGIFIARDKPNILDSLGLDSPKYKNVIDEYIFSMQVFIHKRKYQVDTQSIYHLNLRLNQMLEEKQRMNKDIQNSLSVVLFSDFVLLVGGILFFSDGFFIGENVASFFLSHSIMLSLGLSFSIAIFALAAYWYVERTSMRDYMYNEFFTDQKMTVEKLSESQEDAEIFQFALAR